MVALDAMAKRYGVRPSALVGEMDGAKAFCIDYWAFRWGSQNEEWHRRKAQRNRGR